MFIDCDFRENPSRKAVRLLWAYIELHIFVYRDTVRYSDSTGHLYDVCAVQLHLWQPAVRSVLQARILRSTACVTIWLHAGLFRAVIHIAFGIWWVQVPTESN